MMPYLLKDVFLSSITPAFGNGLFEVEDHDDLTYVLPIAGARSDLKFYDFIKQAEFSADSRENVFTIIHLNCAHVDGGRAERNDGYHIDPVSGEIRSGGNYFTSTRACFEMLNIYFGEMKELGVYDNSAIILLADHGHGSSQKRTASLFIKPVGATGSLLIDTEAELSNLYFGASLLELAGVAHEDLGVSYFDIIGGAPPPTRLHYNFENWWGVRETTRAIRLVWIYEVNGDANDRDNWHRDRDIE